MKKAILQEVALSFAIAVGAVIVIPKVLDGTSTPNYWLALGVFLAMSATFAAYETLFKNKS